MIQKVLFLSFCILFSLAASLFLLNIIDKKQEKPVQSAHVQNVKAVQVHDSSYHQSPDKPSKESYTQYNPDGQWKLVWHDDFTNLDSEKWNAVETGENFNQELQYYTPKNIQVKDGYLYLLAKKETYASHPYTSAKITTQNKFELKYGKITVRAQHPQGKGLFPAIWLLPVKDQVLPEIDMFEAIGSDPRKVYYVNHWNENGELKRTFTSFDIRNVSTFHTYTIEWSPDQIIWSIDNQVRFISKEGIPQEPMYLILNLAIGGKWPGAPDSSTQFPSPFIIDDLKIYKKM